MDRATVYTQEQGRSVDFLFAQRATMIGLAKLSQAAFGSNTVVHGLAVTPNSPAALNVLVGIGEIYSMTAVDATSWGALGADTTDIILKQGLNMAAQTVATPAPSTPGYSINYLIEAQYQDEDTNPVVLPFFNSSNPQQPLNGQGGNGAALPSQRQGMCVVQAKAGAAATTGTQVTPTVDSGWTALAVVTVANGQATVTSSNISIPAGVPQITSILQMMQTGSPAYAVDSSTTANSIALALTPTITSYTDGQEITFKAANSNTGPCTVNAGGGAVNLIGSAGALQGGEIVAGSQYTAIYSASLGEFVINSQTGGAEQVSPATKSQHAMQLGQFSAQAIASGLVRTVKRQTFSASGTYTPSTGMIYCDVELYGGGAGGGGSASGSGGAGAGGGGAGGYCRKLFTAAQIGASQTVTIGALGTGGTAGANSGGAGGNSSFGSYLVANGGTGGTGASSNTASGSAIIGGGGGTATGGDVNLQGATGGAGIGFGSTGAIGGAGGFTIIGHGGGQNINSAGSGAVGAGAAGGGASGTTTANAGGNGYQGFCFITEYCTQ